jgi:hypothetical protein
VTNKPRNSAAYQLLWTLVPEKDATLKDLLLMDDLEQGVRNSILDSSSREDDDDKSSDSVQKRRVYEMKVRLQDD